MVNRHLEHLQQQYRNISCTAKNRKIWDLQNLERKHKNLCSVLGFKGLVENVRQTKNKKRIGFRKTPTIVEIENNINDGDDDIWYLIRETGLASLLFSSSPKCIARLKKKTLQSHLYSGDLKLVIVYDDRRIYGVKVPETLDAFKSVSFHPPVKTGQVVSHPVCFLLAKSSLHRST